MKFFRYCLSAIIGIFIGVFLLTGCTPSLETYNNTKPTASIRQFFDGKIKGYGIIQDYSGDVVSRFDVDMVGTWKGNVGTLDEDFVYYNGTKQKRIWTITQNSDGTYTGQADDIIGTAQGRENGSAVQWVYQMKIPVGDSEYTFTLDDWMWQMNDNIVINRSYFRKLGVTAAELTLVMVKE